MIPPQQEHLCGTLPVSVLAPQPVSFGLRLVSYMMALARCEVSSTACLQVTTPAGEVGTIEGTFGKSGKFTVQFPDGLRGDASATPISLVFKKLIFSPDKRTMMQ